VKIKLFDSELKVMEIIWREGEVRAKDIAHELNGSIGWSKTTTYAVINKCIKKGAVSRGERFLCRPLIPKSEVQENETRELVDKLYDGSKSSLIASLLKAEDLDTQQIEILRELANKL